MVSRVVVWVDGDLTKFVIDFQVFEKSSDFSMSLHAYTLDSNSWLPADKGNQ
jgi:hypothetical protein